MPTAPARMTDHLMADASRARHAYRGDPKTDAKDACVICYYRTGEELARPLYIVKRDGHLRVVCLRVPRQENRALLWR